jgi:hypothetical protein
MPAGAGGHLRSRVGREPGRKPLCWEVLRRGSIRTRICTQCHAWGRRARRPCVRAWSRPAPPVDPASRPPRGTRGECRELQRGRRRTAPCSRARRGASPRLPCCRQACRPRRREPRDRGAASREGEEGQVRVAPSRDAPLRFPSSAILMGALMRRALCRPAGPAQGRTARTSGTARRPGAGPPGRQADPAAGRGCAPRAEASAFRRAALAARPLDEAVGRASRARPEVPRRRGAPFGARRCSATRIASPDCQPLYTIMHGGATRIPGSRPGCAPATRRGRRQPGSSRPRRPPGAAGCALRRVTAAATTSRRAPR